MAVDESLLESTSQSGDSALRFYQWSVPTLSLGYFQPLDDRRQHADSAQCPVVRRTTGGGAIVHDDELTYSLSLPRNASSARTTGQLYLCVHEALIAALEELGVGANIHDSFGSTPKHPPFLCFERRASTDVLVKRHKIAGSAQRRREAAVLQHGSILLGRSAAAPQLPGIHEISGLNLTADDLTSMLLAHLSRNLSMSFEQGELSGAELRRAGEIEHNRYLASDWTNRR